MIRLIARAALQRILPARRSGVTSYYVDGFAGRLAAARWMLDRCGDGVVLDMGCGRDLFLALTAAIVYRRAAIAWDVSAWADPALLAYTARRLGSARAVAGVGDLAALGVSYRVGARLPELAGVRAIASMAVLEHVPEPALEEMFARAAADGVADILADIDLRDHWSYLGCGGPDRFYYHPEWVWRIVNGRRMYQNRLRCVDYEAMAARHGFRVAAAERRAMDLSRAAGRLNPRFSRYRREDLLVAGALMHWRRGGEG